MRCTMLVAIIGSLLPALIAATPAQAEPAARKTPPRVQARPEPRHGVSFLVDGRLVLGLDGGAGMRRPFHPAVGGLSAAAVT